MKRQKKITPPSIPDLEEMGEVILWGDLEDWIEEEGINVPSNPSSALTRNGVEVLVWAEVDDTYGDDTRDFNCGQHPVRLTPVLLQTPEHLAGRFPTRVRCIGYGAAQDGVEPARRNDRDDELVDDDLREHLPLWIEWNAARLGAALTDDEMTDAESMILEGARRGLLDYLRANGKLTFYPRAILLLPEDTSPRVHPSIPLDAAQPDADAGLPETRWLHLRAWLREQRVIQTADGYFRMGPHLIQIATPVAKPPQAPRGAASWQINYLTVRDLNETDYPSYGEGKRGIVGVQGASADPEAQEVEATRFYPYLRLKG